MTFSEDVLQAVNKMVVVVGREGERDKRETERDRERQRDRETEKQRETERQR